MLSLKGLKSGVTSMRSRVLASAVTRTAFREGSSASSEEGEARALSFSERVVARHGPDQIRAPMDYNRWRSVPLAISTHLCLGACYAWSIFNEPLTRELGVVASSSGDWGLPQTVTTFTGIIVAQGMSMAFMGKWVDRVGPRVAGVTGALLYGGGMLLGAAGVYCHQLPLLYLGYGAIAGTGMGIAYLPPVATLIKWFPDRRGLASGMAICGFGGGGLFIVSIKQRLLQRFSELPDFLGTDVVTQRADDGRLLAEVAGQWQELISVSPSMAAAQGLQEGYYVAATGDTGVAATMGLLGCGYLAICSTCAMMVRLPAVGWTPQQQAQQGVEEEAKEEDKKEIPLAVEPYVHVDDVMKTPQFWCVALCFLSTATAGMGLMSCAKDVLGACFSASPLVQQMGGASAFAATYVQALAMGNLGGRIGWASASDYLGRKNAFALFTCIGAPLYLSLPLVVASAVGAESYAPLALFCGSTVAIISFFGAGYSTVPAYESDLFGAKMVGSIHGRMMLASALSGVCGPMVFSRVHDREERRALQELAQLCDQDLFLSQFGSSIDSLQELIDAKAVSIQRLLEICPPGTVDPTPYLYDPAFRVMGGVLGAGAIANFAVSPVNKKWFRTQ